MFSLSFCQLPDISVNRTDFLLTIGWKSMREKSTVSLQLQSVAVQYATDILIFFLFVNTSHVCLVKLVTSGIPLAQLGLQSRSGAWVTYLAFHSWLFFTPQSACDWQDMFPMSAGPETAIILRGCFQSPAPYPLPFREKVKFGPSLTDQRAGPISWWPSTPVKMLTHPYCQCFTFFLYYS